jgi:flagellar basal body rod protein FlgF
MSATALKSAVDGMKDAMAVIAHEFMHGNTPGFEDDLNKVYALLDEAKHSLHEVIDKMTNPEKRK